MEPLIPTKKIHSVDEAKEFFQTTLTLLEPKVVQLAKIALTTPGYFTCPSSATWHHAYEGGNAVHTAQVLQLVLKAVPMFENFNFSSTVIAVLFHDIGKLEEYIHDDYYCYMNKGGVYQHKHEPEYSHLAMSHAIFYNAFRSLTSQNEIGDVNFEDVSHIILSHHGRHEWGSPVEPKTLEATLVHQADIISSHFLG